MAKFYNTANGHYHNTIAGYFRSYAEDNPCTKTNQNKSWKAIMNNSTYKITIPIKLLKHLSQFCLLSYFFSSTTS